MAKKDFMVDLPKKIIFGDPFYFDELKGAKLNNLVTKLSKKDINPNWKCAIRIECSIDENGYEDNRLIIVMSEEKDIPVYINYKHYSNQELKEKRIGVDSASYLIETDISYAEIKTGADGFWGCETKMYSNEKLDAIRICIFVPDFIEKEKIEENYMYIFKNIVKTNFKKK